jgi:hypothetical protein
MNELQLASWLLADSGAWISVVVPGLIALGVLVFVVVACVRHGRQPRHETPTAAPHGRHSVRSAGIVFFSR